METLVNGRPATWTPEIQALWERAWEGVVLPKGSQVTTANYFTPRPYRNEYDRGWPDRGFTYTIWRYGHASVGRCAVR